MAPQSVLGSSYTCPAPDMEPAVLLRVLVLFLRRMVFRSQDLDTRGAHCIRVSQLLCPLGELDHVWSRVPAQAVTAVFIFIPLSIPKSMMTHQCLQFQPNRAHSTLSLLYSLRFPTVTALIPVVLNILPTDKQSPSCIVIAPLWGRLSHPDLASAPYTHAASVSGHLQDKPPP